MKIELCLNATKLFKLYVKIRRFEKKFKKILFFENDLHCRILYLTSRHETKS